VIFRDQHNVSAFEFHSVLSRCWLGHRKGFWPVKTCYNYILFWGSIPNWSTYRTEGWLDTVRCGDGSGGGVGGSDGVVDVHHVSGEKRFHCICASNFAKCWPVFKILSSAVILCIFRCCHRKYVFVDEQSVWIFISNCCQWLSLACEHVSLLHSALGHGEFLSTDISQGSVATHLSCGARFNYCFDRNLLLSLPLKVFGKSVSIWQS